MQYLQSSYFTTTFDAYVKFNPTENVVPGSNLAEKLIAQGWTTYGLARNPNTAPPHLIPVTADLLNMDSLTIALAEVAPTHVLLPVGCGMKPRQKTSELTA